MKVILELDDEKERVLTSSLNLYKKMIEESLNGSAIQKEVSRYEVKLVHQLLTQVVTVQNLRSMLSTVTNAQQKQSFKWTQHLNELKQGKIGSISAITKKGMLLQITYDHQNQAYCLKEENQVVIQTQHASVIERRLQLLNVEDLGGQQ